MKTLLFVIMLFATSCGDNASKTPVEALVAAASDTNTDSTTEEKSDKKAVNEIEATTVSASSDCIDLDPSNVRKDMSYTRCDGTIAAGTLEVLDKSYELCNTNGQIDCIANTSFSAKDPTPDHQDCTANNQVDCIANANYPANDVTNLTAENLKQGVTVADVIGTYNPVPPQCNANGQTSCVANDNFPSNNVENLTPENLRSGVTVAGVSGSFNPTVEAHSNCSSKAQNSCITTSSWIAIASDDYAKIAPTTIRSGVEIADVVGTLQPDNIHPYNVRKGVTINGVAGLIQTRCRNSETSAPADEKCGLTPWVQRADWSEDRISGLKVLNSVMSGTGIQAKTACQIAGIQAIDDGGWRLPSQEELQQLTLDRMRSLPTFTPDLNKVGAWAANYSAASNPSAYVTWDGSIAAAPFTDTNKQIICVKPFTMSL